MQNKKNKSIGKVVDSDFNNTPGALNDVSDIDISELQYTSPILEKMKKDGVYHNLCNKVRAMKIADKSDSFIIRQIKKQFNTYCGNLTPATFKRWLGGEYRELSEAYYFGRDIALGELISMGLERARVTIHSDKSDDFILKLMDRLDNGLISHRNKPEVIEKEVESSKLSNQTINTINKMFAEAERFGGLSNVEVTDDPVDDEDYTTREDGINE